MHIGGLIQKLNFFIVFMNYLRM